MRPGALATAMAAAWARRLQLPTTKASKVKAGLSRGRGQLGLVAVADPRLMARAAS